MNQKGQTSVEYIMLLVIVVTIATSLFGLMEDKIVGQDGIMGKYIEDFNAQFSNNYKTFTLRR